MTPTEQHERSERLRRLRAQVGSAIIDELLRVHRFNGQQPTPRGLLGAMEEVETWTPSLPAPEPVTLHYID